MQHERQNVIGGHHVINQNVYALSLVRKFAAQHAYLILESINEQGEHVTHDAHLVVKEGTGNTKADIVYRVIELDQLMEVSEGCHSITWNISREQAEALLALIEAEQGRAENNLINYITLGKSKASGFLGSASKASGSEASNDSIQDIRVRINQEIDGLPEDARGKFEEFQLKAKFASMESVDMLLREGHSCISWAIAMIKAMQIDYDPGYFKTLVFVNPNTIVNGNHNGNDDPTTKCVLL